jgi:hypothetical protein
MVPYCSFTLLQKAVPGLVRIKAAEVSTLEVVVPLLSVSSPTGSSVRRSGQQQQQQHYCPVTDDDSGK